MFIFKGFIKPKYLTEYGNCVLFDNILYLGTSAFQCSSSFPVFGYPCLIHAIPAVHLN